MFLEWKHLDEIKVAHEGDSFQISSAKVHKIFRTAKQISRKKTKKPNPQVGLLLTPIQSFQLVWELSHIILC